MIPGACDRRGRTREGYRFPRCVRRRGVVLGFLVVSALGTVGCVSEVSKEAGADAFPASLDHWLAERRETVRFSRAGTRDGGIEQSDPSVLGFASGDQLRFALQVEEELEQLSEIDRLHPRGIARALKGDLDGAVDDLGHALAEFPERSDLALDLATVLLLRHESRSSRNDLLDAIGHLRRVLDAEPDNATAWFSYADAVSRLHLKAESAEAYRRFLEIEPGDIRAQKALLDLSRSAVDRSPVDLDGCWSQSIDSREIAADPGRYRTYAIEKFLPAWVEARRTGDVDAADRCLAATRRIGQELDRLCGDKLVADTVAAIDRFAGVGSVGVGGTVDQIFRGVALFGEAMEAYGNQASGARSTFQSAARRLREVDLPLWGMAAYRLAAVEHHTDPLRAIATLVEVVEELPEARYPQLHGYCRLLLGTLETTTGDPEAGIEQYERARPLLASAAPDIMPGYFHPAIADALRSIGQSDAAWKEYELGLEGTSRTPGSAARSIALYGAVEYLVEEGHGGAALAIAEEMVKDLTDRSAASFRAQAFLQLGRASSALGGWERASRALDRAALWAPRIERPQLREQVVETIEVARAGILARAQPREAIALLDRVALQRLEKGYFYRLGQLFLSRAEAHGRVGEYLEQGDALRAFVNLQDSLRREVQDPSLRRGMFAQSRAGYEAMIIYQMDRELDPVAAFEYAERGRTRELLEAMGDRGAYDTARSGAQPDLRALQGRLAGDEITVSVQVLEDRLLIWTVTSDDFRVTTRPWTRTEVRRRIERLSSRVDRRAPAEEIRSIGSEIHEALFADLRELATADDRLVLILDPTLSDLRVEALHDPRAGRPLGATRPILFSPSLTAFVGPGRSRQRSGRMVAISSVLVVADPAFSAREHPDLQRLPGATKEAAEVRALFPAGEVLTGARATPERIIQALEDHPVAYFAVHSQKDGSYAERSGLVLADETAGSLLRAQEIQELDLQGVDLVVLAVCSTIEGAEDPMEGITGLVAAFLGAGVEYVVAIPTAVGDEIGPPLRAALARLLEHGDPARAWWETYDELPIDPDPHGGHAVRIYTASTPD